MEVYEDDDLIRMKELLRRTGEFIAYFELAETKMIQWRQELEQRASQLQQYSQLLEKELVSAHDLLSQTGISNFSNVAEKVLAQGETNLKNIEQSCNQFAQNVQQQQEQLKILTDQSIEKIEQHNTLAMQNITTQLSKYDVHHFHRIANESCDHVEHVANETIVKSNKLLQMLHLRSALFAVIISVIASFIISLYLSDESPWEMHNHALNERQAGKLLLQAWPNLTQLEKSKILNHEPVQHD